jgi:hypothetical protein
MIYKDLDNIFFSMATKIARKDLDKIRPNLDPNDSRFVSDRIRN